MQHVLLTLLPKAPINMILFMTAEGLDVTIPYFQPPQKSWGQDGCDGSESAQDKNECKKEGEEWGSRVWTKDAQHPVLISGTLPS